MGIRTDEVIGGVYAGAIYCNECCNGNEKDYLLADKPNDRTVRCSCCGRDLERIAGIVTDSKRREPLDRCGCDYGGLSLDD